MISALRDKRKSRNLTIQEMSELLGYKSNSTYAKKERGEIAITVDEAKKICLILNCTLNDIFFANKLS